MSDFQFWRIAHRTLVTQLVDGHKNSKQNIVLQDVKLHYMYLVRIMSAFDMMLTKS